VTIRIAVNEAILSRGVSGSARVTGYLIEALREVRDANVRGVRPSRSRGSSRLTNAIGDASWDLVGASRAARGADLLVSPCNIGHAWSGQRHVLMVHDVMVWEAREHFDPAFAAYARRLIPLSMKSADLVLTVSEHSRAALAAMAPGIPIKIVHPPAPANRAPRVCFPRSAKTVVVLGETAPHKNQIAAIEAVRMLRAECGIDVALRVIGPSGRAEGSVRDRLHKVDPRGEWTTREEGLSDAELGTALGSAWVLVQASLHEGYGLPLVEAAQLGLPVVHSGREGMVDILPESSVQSVSAEAFTERLVSLLDESTWVECSDYGLGRATLFTREAFTLGVVNAVADVLDPSAC